MVCLFAFALHFAYCLFYCFYSFDVVYIVLYCGQWASYTRIIENNLYKWMYYMFNTVTISNFCIHTLFTSASTTPTPSLQPPPTLLLASVKICYLAVYVIVYCIVNGSCGPLWMQNCDNSTCIASVYQVAEMIRVHFF